MGAITKNINFLALLASATASRLTTGATPVRDLLLQNPTFSGQGICYVGDTTTVSTITGLQLLNGGSPLSVSPKQSQNPRAGDDDVLATDLSHYHIKADLTAGTYIIFSYFDV